MADNKEKKSFSKTIQTVIISLLVVVVAAGSVAYGIHFVMQNEGVYEIAEHRNSKTAVSINPNKAAGETDVLSYVKTLVDGLSDSTAAKVNYSKSFSVDKNSITCADEALTKDLKVASSNIANNLKKNYFEDYSGKFGESTGAVLPSFALTDNDVNYAIISEAITTQEEFAQLLGADYTIVPNEDYQAAANKTNLVSQSVADEFLKLCKDDTDNEYYYVHISAKGGNLENVIVGNVSDTFKISETYAKLEQVKNDIASEVGATATAVCDDLTVDLKIDRFNDTIVSLKYNAAYTVNANLAFTGSLEKYGRQQVSFKFSTQTSYTPKYAGLYITDDVIYIEKGDEKEIANSFNVEDEDEQTAVLTWTSENPEIVEITENGYITGKEYTTQPVKVYGHAEYLGKTYDVCCNVYVIKPVENITLNEKELNMKSGETHQLSYVLEPADATITDAYWISSDEAVATVNENGVVTAIGSGSCSVIAVSKNENFKSTCQVTVE